MYVCELYGVYTVRVRAYLRGAVASIKMSECTDNCPISSASCEVERGSNGVGVRHW